MFKDKNTILNEVKKFWEKEFYRLIDPYRDVLDNSSVETLKARMKSILDKQIEVYRDALIWCSGSDDFQVGRKAREGWEKICLPLLRK